MPPRLNKRQQREQEELQALRALHRETAASTQTEGQEESEPEPNLPSRTIASGFSALALPQVDSEEDSEHEEAPQAKVKSKRKKKKKPSVKASATEGPIPTSTTPISKKAKSKAREASKPAEATLESQDLDAILKQMAVKYPDMQSSQPSSQSSNRKTLCDLLAVVPAFLDGDEELRRFFGSKVMKSEKPKQRADKHTPRSQLTTPPPTWYHIRAAQGVTMRQLSDTELHRKPYKLAEDRWWTFEHAQSYKKTEMEFLSAVAMGDPNAFSAILQQHPWHIDTLLQLSEAFRHQEDFAHGQDLVGRALFAYERAFAPSFNITSGTNRLDFDYIENRPLFMALHRQILQLERRGCMRAAFEFARLLLSLDPFGDPHGALLHLDYLAPRCGMNDWIIKLWDTWDTVANEERQSGSSPLAAVNPQFLPGMSYGRAAALWNTENEKGDKTHEASTRALERAILDWPMVLPVLADKAGINLPPTVRMHPSTRIEPGWLPNSPAMSAIHLLSHLYGQRSASIWKQPTHVEWVQKAVNKVSSAFDSAPEMQRSALRERALDYFRQGPTLAVCRHIVICEIRGLLAFLKPGTLPPSMLAYDPLPPESSVSNYDEAYFGPLSKVFAREQAQYLRQRIRQALANPELAGLAAELNQFVDHGEGHIPGGFGDDDVQANAQDGVQELDPEDDSDGEVLGGRPAPEENAEQAQGPGFWQNLWNGLWAGRPDGAQSDGEDA